MRATLLVLLIVTSLIPLHAAVTPSKAELHTWFDKALEAASVFPAEQRRTLAYSPRTPANRTDMIRFALFKIALRPSSPGWFDLVKAMEVPPENSSMTREEYDERRDAAFEFLDATYRARAGTDNAEAREWQHGLAEMLFTTGNFEEALRLAREVDANEPSVAYRTILLAMMEKVAGNDEPFAKISADCPQPTYQNEGTGAQFCKTVVESILRRVLATLEPERVPAVIHEMLTGGDWQERMHGFELLRRGDAKGVREQLEKIAASSDAPPWAKDDAIFTLERHARRSNDWARAASLIDCWFARRAIAFPPMTAEMWQQLSAMAYDPTDDVSAKPSCYLHHDPKGDIPTECILYGLQTKIIGASTTQDETGARIALEAMATVVLETGTGLRDLAGLLRGVVAGGKDRDRILQYAATLEPPVTFEEEETAAAVRKQTARAPLAPWEPIHRNAERIPSAVDCQSR